MPAFSALRALLGVGLGFPSLAFTTRTAGGLGNGLTRVAVNPAGIWLIGGSTDSVSSDTYAASSPDGNIWTERTTPTFGTGLNAHGCNGIVWDGSLFYFMSSETSNWSVLTTAGEANLVDRPTTSGAISVRGFGFKDDGTNVFAVTTLSVMKSSPTAQTWTDRTLPQTPLPSVYGPKYGGGLFVQGGKKFTGDLSLNISTSPDAITWTARDFNSDAGSNYAAYNVATHTWCMVGDKILGDASIATSPDGITWTQRSNTFPGNDVSSALVAVAAVPTGFVAVGYQFNKPGFASVYVPVIYFSEDNGVTWTEDTGHPFFEDNNTQYNDIAYHASTGKIVIVGSEILINSRLVISN